MNHTLSICLIFSGMVACSGPPPTNNGATEVTVLIETDRGDITLALYPDAAPVTVTNFVDLARSGALNDTSFYRTVREDNDRPDARIDVIQGGAGFDGLTGATPIAHESTSETGLSHIRGAISMARDGVGTASSEFFIVVTDSTNLDAGPGGRNPDEAGYAVFGQVTDGMDVVETIWMASTGAEDAPEGYSQQWLDPAVSINRISIEN